MPPVRHGEQHRGWCFTLFTDGSGYNRPPYNPLHMKFLVYQLEECPRTHKLHYQGYMQLNSAKTFEGAKRLLRDDAHIEPARNVKASIAYAQKEDTRKAGPWQYGTEPHQGSRTDTQEVAEMVRDDATMAQIAEQHPATYMRMFRGIGELRQALHPPESMARISVLLWGETGTGKTRWAYETYPTLYTVFSQKEPWFDGYDGQDVVLFDDAGKGTCGYNTIKRLTDRYPQRIPIKGGSAVWRAKVIIFTTNDPHYESWWGDIPAADVAALDRRIRKFKIPDELEALNAYVSPRGEAEAECQEFQHHQDRHWGEGDDDRPLAGPPDLWMDADF